MFILCLSLPATQPADLLNKKPAIGWQSRVFWKFFVVLEGPSHDANAASAALPHGRMSIDALGAQANVVLNDHFGVY